MHNVFLWYVLSRYYYLASDQTQSKVYAPLVFMQCLIHDPKMCCLRGRGMRLTHDTLPTSERLESPSHSFTVMSFVHAHGFTINKSTFNDIQGDYHYNATTPGERGMARLCTGAQNLLNI